MAALIVSIAVAVIVFSMPRYTNSDSDAPNVKFIEFNPDGRDINVGENTRILFNVQNLEMRPITEHS